MIDIKNVSKWYGTFQVLTDNTTTIKKGEVVVATMLTLFVVPVIYGALARFTRSPEYTARKIEAWEARENTANDAAPAAAE